jgi:hypothetical protein
MWGFMNTPVLDILDSYFCHEVGMNETISKLRELKVSDRLMEDFKTVANMYRLDESSSLEHLGKQNHCENELSH